MRSDSKATTVARVSDLNQRRFNVLAKLIPVRLWTRRCPASCGDTSAHDSHLTWLGRKALGI